MIVRSFCDGWTYWITCFTLSAELFKCLTRVLYILQNRKVQNRKNTNYEGVSGVPGLVVT